jgi:thymidylate kinase
MKNQLSALLTDWDEGEISYCVWKGIAKFEKVLLCEEDLDILIDRDKIEDARLILKKNGFVEFRNITSRSDVGTLDFLKFFEDGKWMHIHVHLNILFGNSAQRDYRLSLETIILQSRVWDSDFEVWAIAPYYDLSLFLVRHSLRARSVIPSARYESDLREIKSFYQGKNVRFIASDFNRIIDFPEVIKRLVVGYDNVSVKDLEAVGGPIKRFYKFQREAIDVYYLSKTTVNLFVILSMKIRMAMGFFVYKKRLTQSGLIVAFVGIDGSGKSSAIERLSNKLTKHISVLTVSMGSGVSGASWYRRIIFKIFGTKAKFKGHVSARSERTTRLKSNLPWYYVFWLIICLWDKKKELHRALTCKARGGLVLSDRWLQDETQSFIDSPRVASNGKKNVINKYLYRLEAEVFRLVKQSGPDYIIRLDVSAENSVFRKPNDLNLQQAHNAAQKIRELTWNNIPLAAIDANKKIEDVDRDLNVIIQSILDASFHVKY